MPHFYLVNAVFLCEMVVDKQTKKREERGLDRVAYFHAAAMVHVSPLRYRTAINSDAGTNPPSKKYQYQSPTTTPKKHCVLPSFSTSLFPGAFDSSCWVRVKALSDGDEAMHGLLGRR